MRQFKIALLAGALAFATTATFAQVGVGGSAGTSGGAAVGTGSGGTSGSTQLKSGAGADVNAGGTNAGADVNGEASGNTKMKKNQTTGSGAASGSGKMPLDKD
jgi:hypothetical protein